MKFPILIILAAACLSANSQTVRSFPTVSAMDTNRASRTESISEVTGMNSQWDWGPAVRRFIFDSTNTLPTNAFRRAVPGSITGRRIHDWPGDVRAFGALPDDGVDDTAAIAAATAHALSGPYGELYFPAGTYVVEQWRIEPVTNTLLRIRGQSANPASAVDPYGSRILLKPGSTNVLLTVQFTNDFTKRLRIDVAGMYFDGNRYECTNASDVVVLSGKPGPATNYITCGQWVDCAFNRGARHGLNVTNHLFQLELTSCNLQSNGDTALVMDRGGDHKFTKVLLEKAGKLGYYGYKTDNTTWQDCDIGFCGAGIKLDDVRHMRFVNTDISFHGGPCVEIYSSSSQNNSANNQFIGCRIGSANSSASGVPLTYATGTYSAVVFTGNSALNYAHSFVGCTMYAAELGSTTVPKYVFEDQRSASVFTNSPGFGISIIGCSTKSATNYVVNGVFSPRFTEFAQLFAHGNSDATLTMTNALNGLELRGRFNSYGIANFGNATNTIPAVNIDGGVSATDIQTWNREGNSKFGLAISGNILRINDVTNATQMVAFEDTASAAIMYLGGNTGTPRQALFYATLPSGTNAQAGPFKFYSLGTGAGAITNAALEYYIPVAGSSGSSIQSSRLVFQVPATITGKRTSLFLWDNEAGSLKAVTTTNLTVGGYTGKFLVFE